MVNQMRSDESIRTNQFYYRTQFQKRIAAPTEKRKRNQSKSLCLDALPMIRYTGSNSHIKPRVPRCTGQIEPMRPEIPILSDEQKKAGAGAHSRSSQA
jgi:hypothetical protein